MFPPIAQTGFGREIHACAEMCKPESAVKYGSLPSPQDGSQQAISCAHYLTMMGQFVQRSMVLLIALFVLFKIDLSLLDVSGRYIFEIDEWVKCGAQSFTGPSAPFMATAYQLPGGVLATVVLCPPCRCQVSTLTLDSASGFKSTSYHWMQGHSWRTGEAAMGLGDFTADVWLFHWKANDEDQQMLSVGNRIKLGSLDVEVVAAPSSAPAPQVAICTSVYSASSLEMPQSSWFAAWVAHHFSGIHGGAGQLFLYGPELESKASALTLAGNSTVINLFAVHGALNSAWAAQHADTDAMPGRLRDHVVQLFSLQDCLYRAKAAGTPWLFQADVDEVLNFGEHNSMAGMLGWADVQKHEAITFGSILHSVTRCVGANATIGPADEWHHHFPCRMPTTECSSGVENKAVNKMLRNIDETTKMDNDCLGPRGRRKYLVRPSSTEFLQVHTPPVLIAHHMGHEPNAAVFRHYQGLLSHGRDLCTDESRPMQCQLDYCHAWRNQSVCESA